jgi:hypothetical protein
MGPFMPLDEKAYIDSFIRGCRSFGAKGGDSAGVRPRAELADMCSTVSASDEWFAPRASTASRHEEPLSVA